MAITWRMISLPRHVGGWLGVLDAMQLVGGSCIFSFDVEAVDLVDKMRRRAPSGCVKSILTCGCFSK